MSTEKTKENGSEGFPTLGYEGRRMDDNVYKALIQQYSPDENLEDHQHYKDPDSTIEVDIIDREAILPLLIPGLKKLGKYEEYQMFVEEHKNNPDLSLMCLDKAHDLMMGSNNALQRDIVDGKAETRFGNHP